MAVKAFVISLLAAGLAGCVAQPQVDGGLAKPVVAADPTPAPTVMKAAPPLPPKAQPTTTKQLRVKESDLRPKAEAGDAKAQAALGRVLLERGSYFDPSPEGVAWLEKAAGQGSREAQMSLAYRYRAAYCGTGPIARNDKCDQARRWFLAAAATGDNGAMVSLVSMLPQPPFNDPAEAYYWALIRQRQRAMPPSSWIEESTSLKAGLTETQVRETEKRVESWHVEPVGLE